MTFQPYYIAPEVFLQNYNQKIDVWSMGVVLYIMLSGKVPFPGNSELEIIGNVIKGDFHFNHEPFQRHSPEAKDFLMCLIRKDVATRYTAMQAFNHPWLQENASKAHSTQSISSESFVDMKNNLDKARTRKAVLTMLSEKIKRNNFVKLQELMVARDPQRTGKLASTEFMECLREAGQGDTQRVLDEMMLELDPNGTGSIDYFEFLSAVFLT